MPASAPDAPLAMPLPLGCIGVPVCHWTGDLQSDDDVRQCWLGYALGGAAGAIVLIVEILAICLLF